jgi:hypothetical protein
MTRNGSISRPLIFFMPAAIRFRVFPASGFLRAKIFSPFNCQSMISRAARHGFSDGEENSGACGDTFSRGAWEGMGQLGAPFRVATTNRRLRVVASP